MKSKIFHAFLWIFIIVILGMAGYQCRNLRGYVRIRFLQILHLIFPSRNLSESQTNLYTLHTAAARLRFSRALLFLLGKAPK